MVNGALPLAEVTVAVEALIAVSVNQGKHQFSARRASMTLSLYPLALCFFCD
jgi:hypothetical protein